MALHSKIGASSMYRWEACPASVKFCQDLPRKSSKYAEEGNRVHDLCERALLGEDPFSLPYLGEGTEELDAVCLYVDTIKKDRTPDARLYVEVKLDLELVFPGCFGTADAVLYSPAEKLLRVYDFKYGKSLVKVEDNAQLHYYALGAAICLGLPFSEFEIVIVQPRCTTKSRTVRRERRPAFVLLDFWERLRSSAARTVDPNALFTAGGHCYFCDGKETCPEQIRVTQEKAKNDFDDL